MSISKIPVFLAIDSARVRVLLRETLNATGEFQVVAAVPDPLALIDGSTQRMGGVTPRAAIVDPGFSSAESTLILRRLLARTSCPVLSLGSARDAAPGSDVAMERLGAGVLDVLERPEDEDAMNSVRVSRILASLRMCAGRLREQAVVARDPDVGGKKPGVSVPQKPGGLESTGISGLNGVGKVGTNPSTTQMVKKARTLRGAKSSIYRPVEKARLQNGSYHPRQVLLIGASTGGTEAICDLLQRFPQDMPGICIVQHIPPVFSKSFAERLNALCALEVKEAVHGDVVRAGLALVAPGGYHMELRFQNGRYEVKLTMAPEEHHQRPAVDVLFRTAADAAGRYAMGVLLTGMGRDGALGMKHLRNAGAVNLAQDERSCVVYGMPAAARELGVVDEMVSLQDMHLAVQRRLMQIRGTLAAA